MTLQCSRFFLKFLTPTPSSIQPCKALFGPFLIRTRLSSTSRTRSRPSGGGLWPIQRAVEQQERNRGSMERQEKQLRGRGPPCGSPYTPPLRFDTFGEEGGPLGQLVMVRVCGGGGVLLARPSHEDYEVFLRVSCVCGSSRPAPTLRFGSCGGGVRGGLSPCPFPTY